MSEGFVFELKLFHGFMVYLIFGCPRDFPLGTVPVPSIPGTQLPIPDFDIPNTFHRVITKSVRLVNICGLERNNEWNSIFLCRQYGSYLMTQFGPLSRDTVTVLLVWYCFYVFWWDFWIFEKFLGDGFSLRDKLKLSALHSLNVTINKFWRDWDSNPGPLDQKIPTWE